MMFPQPSVPPYSPGLKLLPKRTTVVRRSKLPGQQQRQSENAHPQQIPPARRMPDLDEDHVIGEVDRPLPPSEKPES